MKYLEVNDFLGVKIADEMFPFFKLMFFLFCVLAPIVVQQRNHAEDKLLLGCEDGMLVRQHFHFNQYFAIINHPCCTMQSDA